MSMLFMDSVDHYNTSEIYTKWTTVGNGTFITAGGRNGQGIALGQVNKSTKLSTVFITGFATNVEASTGFGPIEPLYTIANVNQDICTLAVGTDGSLSLWCGAGTSVFMGSSLSANPPFYIHPNTWYYFEVKFSIGSGINLPVTGSLQVNGVEVIASCTANSGVNGNSFLVPNSGGNFHSWTNLDIFGNTIIDDINIKDNSGTYNNDFIGDVRLGCLFPLSDVTTQWTGLVPGNQFSQINAQFPLGDSSYVFATSDPMSPTTPFDNFNWQPVPPFLGNIVAVQYLVWARKDDEGTRQIRQFCGLPTTIAPGALSPTWSLSDTYLYYYYDMDVDPDTMLPWTQGGFNSKQFGFQLVG